MPSQYGMLGIFIAIPSIIGGKISYTGELMPDDENLNIIYYNDGAEPITAWQRNK